jgi:hypothetical protein
MIRPIRRWGGGAKQGHLAQVLGLSGVQTYYYLIKNLNHCQIISQINVNNVEL